MNDKEKEDSSARHGRPPAATAGRIVGVFVGTVVGCAAELTGLLAGIPAPDVLLRALGAGLIAKFTAGLLGAVLFRSLMTRKPADASPAEGER